MDAGSGRRDPFLLLSAGASLALALTLYAWPAAPWRLPLALLGGLWAPGYAILAAVHPRGRLAGLERHALSLALGLLAAPLAGLAASETVGLHPAGVGLVLAALTLATGGLAWTRGARGPEPATRATLPGTRATLAISGAALGAAALLALPALLVSADAPSSLALAGPDGGALPLRLPPGAETRVSVEAASGDEHVSGDLVVAWRPEGGAWTMLRHEPLALAPHQRALVPVALPAMETGAHRLAAWWDGREVYATFHVGAEA